LNLKLKQEKNSQNILLPLKAYAQDSDYQPIHSDILDLKAKKNRTPPFITSNIKLTSKG
jgi:hypothetical protein